MKVDSIVCFRKQNLKRSIFLFVDVKILKSAETWKEIPILRTKIKCNYYKLSSVPKATGNLISKNRTDIPAGRTECSKSSENVTPNLK